MRNPLLFLLALGTAPAALAGPLEQLAADRAFLDQATGSRETLNRVTLLHLGKSSRPVRLALLRGAKRSLLISVPYWFDDEAGREAYRALEANVESNPRLDARVLEDWTSPGSTKDLFAVRMALRLKRLTGSFLLWNPPWWLRSFSGKLLSGRLHDKLLVADGEKLLMGGMNIGDMYLEGGQTRKGWHDTDVLIEGPAAADAATIFVKIWELGRHYRSLRRFPSQHGLGGRFLADYFYRGRELFRYSTYTLGLRRDHEVRIPLAGSLRQLGIHPEPAQPVEGGVPVRLIYDNPMLQKGLPGACNFHCVLERLLGATRVSARLFIPYLTVTKEFEQLLARTARRGVKVEILTNSARSHDLGPAAYWAAFNHYPALLRAGVRIHEWQGHKPLLALEEAAGCEIPEGHWPGHTLHTKAVILDGELGILGSHNMNKRSQSLNTEVMAVVADPAFAAGLNAIFEQNLSRAPRGLPCGRRLLAAPPRTLEMSLPAAEAVYRKNRGKVRFYRAFESFF